MRHIDGQGLAQNHKSEPGSSAFKALVLFLKLLVKNLLKASICQLKKKCTTWKLRVKFYLGGNQDLNPEDSISGSPEKALGGGEAGSWDRSFCNKGKVVGTKGLQITRFTENQFLWENVRVWAYWNLFFDIHLSYGPVFVSFLSSLRAHQPTLGSAWSHRCHLLSANFSPGGRISESTEIFP